MGELPRMITATGNPGYEILDSYKVNDVFNWVVEFQVPLYYGQLEPGLISIVATVTKYFKDVKAEEKLPMFGKDDKVVCFLQGGPGFASYKPLDSKGFIGCLLEKNYTVVNYDQRGTGLSTPLSGQTLVQLGRELGLQGAIDDGVNEYVELISAFRADSIVKDCEEIRKRLFKHSPSKKWSIMGQSYGGFCCNTYLSYFPESLLEVFITGGIPEIGAAADVDHVYEATYRRTIERNKHYYTKYRGDIQLVKRVVKYLHEHKVVLPNNGVLSVERFQQVGLRFGGSGGTDSIHQLVFTLDYEIKKLGAPTYETLTKVQNNLSFDTNIIYALFQEAIYMDGPGKPSNWSAERLRHQDARRELFDIGPGPLTQQWIASDKPIFFTGEMVYKSMYDDYAELRNLKKLAYAIHQHKNWGSLYNADTLKQVFDCENSHSWNRSGSSQAHVVKVVAAIYYNDQYVDFDLSRKTAETVYGKIRTYVTSQFFHNGIGASPEVVMDNLFKLLDSEVD